MKVSKLYLGYAGFCYAKENHAITTGRNQDVKFKALWGLIEHPTEGYVLFDTGYTERFYEATKHYPSKIYAQLTKVNIRPEEEVKAQLLAHDISTDSIKHVFVSHFHADHVGGLKDFPNATIHASRKAVDQLKNVSKTFGFTKGILTDLIPDDLMNRVSFIDEKPGVQIPVFGQAFDVFGDGHLIAVPLPGHAAGQMGLMLTTKKHTYFLIADACWLKESYQIGTLPNSMVRLFFDSWPEFKSTLEKVMEYHKLEPSALIIPTHCAETTDPLVSPTIDLDVL